MRFVIFLACQDAAADKDREFINHISQCDDSLCLEDFNEQSSMFNPSDNPDHNKRNSSTEKFWNRKWTNFWMTTDKYWMIFNMSNPFFIQKSVSSQTLLIFLWLL